MNEPTPTTHPSGYAARPDYRVDLLQRQKHVEARAGKIRLAASGRAIVVDEQDHALVVYFPRPDVDMAALVSLSPKRTHCPFKGEADYWTLAARPGEPIAWSYETPYPEVAGIAWHIAFYHDRVEIVPGAERC